MKELGWWEETVYDLPSSASSPKSQEVFVSKAVEVPVEDDDRSISSSSSTLVDMDEKQIDSEACETASTLVDPSELVNTVKIICTPAQHNSGRGLLRWNQTLWASWIIELPRHGNEPWRVFFGG